MLEIGFSSVFDLGMNISYKVNKKNRGTKGFGKFLLPSDFPSKKN
jgi:hypothetical protein